MRLREMRELSAEEIQTNIDDTRKELVELRLENTAKLGLARTRLARLLTVQTERQSQQQASKK